MKFENHRAGKASQLAPLSLMLSVFIWLVGCVVNPVENWTCLFSSGASMANYRLPDEQLHQKYRAIIDDYQAYIQTAKMEHPSWFISSVDIYEDKTGRHRVKLVIETDMRAYTDFFLMYDRSDARVRVIKGTTEHAFHI